MVEINLLCEEIFGQPGKLDRQVLDNFRLVNSRYRTGDQRIGARVMTPRYTQLAETFGLNILNSHMIFNNLDVNKCCNTRGIISFETPTGIFVPIILLR